MQAGKTNVMRILEHAHIPYTAHHYEVNDGQLDGLSAAEKLQIPPEYVYKTLVAMGASHIPCVFVIPVGEELDLKAAARAVKEKSVSMLPLKELLPTTGYIRGGCSPIGMKKAYKTVVDESCLPLKRVLVSAGKVGSQVELAPEDLLGLTQATAAPLCKKGTK